MSISCAPIPESGYVLSSTAANIDASGRVLGHEGIGAVVEAGADVDHVGRGRRGDVRVDRRVWSLPAVPARVAEPVPHGIADRSSARRLVRHRRRRPREAGPHRHPRGEDRRGPARAGVRRAGRQCRRRVRDRRGGAQRLGRGVRRRSARLVLRDGEPARAPGQAGRGGRATSRHDGGLAEPWCDATFGVEEFFATDGSATVDVAIEASGAMSNATRVLGRMGPAGRVALLGRSGEPLVIDAGRPPDQRGGGDSRMSRASGRGRRAGHPGLRRAASCLSVPS